MRADRLLRGMRQVCSHDLPNQLVALQSLLEMLHLEDGDRLSHDGQEYVDRMKKAAQRMTELVRFLKDLEALARVVARPEEIALTTLAREVQEALTQALPDRQFAFDWQWGVAAVRADYRTLLQGLVEILSWWTARHGVRCLVACVSVREEKRVALRFQLRTVDPAGHNPLHEARPGGAAPLADKSLEIIRAREYLAISQASLEWDADGDRFAVLLPNP